MFIDQGSVVDIIDGRLAGRRGVVDKLRIVSETGAVMAFVHVFNLETGGVDLMIFEPTQLAASKLTPIQRERYQLAAAI